MTSRKDAEGKAPSINSVAADTTAFSSEYQEYERLCEIFAGDQLKRVIRKIEYDHVLMFSLTSSLLANVFQLPHSPTIDHLIPACLH